MMGCPRFFVARKNEPRFPGVRLLSDPFQSTPIHSLPLRSYPVLSGPFPSAPFIICGSLVVSKGFPGIFLVVCRRGRRRFFIVRGGVGYRSSEGPYDSGNFPWQVVGTLSNPDRWPASADT
jgi:hypothetical protein